MDSHRKTSLLKRPNTFWLTVLHAEINTLPMAYDNDTTTNSEVKN